MENLYESTDEPHPGKSRRFVFQQIDGTPPGFLPGTMQSVQKEAASKVNLFFDSIFENCISQEYE